MASDRKWPTPGTHEWPLYRRLSRARPGPRRRLPKGHVVDALSQIIRRPPLATLGNKTRNRVEDTVVVAGHSEDMIQRRLCKCPLLFLKSRCVQATCLIKAFDVVHAPNHADRPALGSWTRVGGRPWQPLQLRTKRPSGSV